jgi:hypothetical protein
MEKLWISLIVLVAMIYPPNVHAQVDERDSHVATPGEITALTFTFTHRDSQSAVVPVTHKFEFVFGSTPSTASITITPYGSGGAPGVAVTSSVAGNQNLFVSGPWDYYIVTVTWTGTPGSVQLNVIGSHLSMALKTGNGRLTPSVTSAPADGCATWSGGNLGSVGSACGSGGTGGNWTTPRLLAGNSVDGSANVPFTNKFIVQGTSDTGLSSAQFLGALATCMLKNTTATGVLSCAAAADVPTIAESQVTSLTTDLAAKVPSTRQVAGHALSADVTLAEGDIGSLTSDLAAKVPSTRQVAGHALSSDVTLAEGDITSLTTDLAARPIGTLSANDAVQAGNATQSQHDTCAHATTTQFDTSGCTNTITGAGITSTSTAPTVGKFGVFSASGLTAATSGTLATSSNLFLIGGSRTSGSTYYYPCPEGTICPATFTGTITDGYSVEYDPTSQLAIAVATCTAGNWVIGRTDGSGNVLSEPHPCAFQVEVNNTALTTTTTADIQNSTANAVGLSVTISNPNTNKVQAEVSGTYGGALASGVTATTQTVNDNSTKVATTAYADRVGGGTNNGTPMLGSSNFSALAVSTNWIYLQGSGNSSTTQVQKETVMSGPGTFSNLSVLCIGTTTGTMTITLQKAAAGAGNPVDTSLSITVNAGCTAGTQVIDNNAGHNVTVVLGDVLDYKVVQSVATATNATITYPSVLFK